MSFYRGDVKAFETAPLAVTDGLDAKTKAVPLRFSLPLESFAPGRYDCQVTVLDPGGQKAAFWRAPIVARPGVYRALPPPGRGSQTSARRTAASRLLREEFLRQTRPASSEPRARPPSAGNP